MNSLIYDKKLKKFIITVNNRKYYSDSFNHVYKKYIHNRSYNVDLSGYDFNGVDLTKYDISDVKVDVEILKKLGIYNSTLYYSIITNTKNVNDGTNVLSRAKKQDIQNNIYSSELKMVDGFDISDSIYNIRFWYISDIHLDEKILSKFPNYATREEIFEYIDEVIYKLHLSLPTDSQKDFYGIPKNKVYDYLLIAGDVSHNEEIFNYFVTNVSRMFYRTLFCFGNHEHWFSDKVNHEIYSSIFHQVYKLDNSILIIELNENPKKTSSGRLIHGFTETIVDKETLLNGSLDELNDIFLKSAIVIFGGTGFAGLNSVFNADSGLYLDKISRDLEKSLSKECFYIHERLKSVAYDKKVIYMTHNPLSDWIDEKEIVPWWIYVNGHTHKNQLEFSNDKCIIANNQIGYKNEPTLKFFKCGIEVDYFKEYKDGIYDISQNEYVMFNLGKGIDVSTNRIYKSIKMIKKNGLYMFFTCLDDTLYLLDGFKKRKIKIQDLNYYDQNIGLFRKNVNCFIDSYNKSLNEIAKFVKSINGSGKIHGSIVDIDYYNHIYLNPFDGTVVPYSATSTTDKHVYKNVASLLVYEGLVKEKLIESNKHELITSDQELTRITEFDGSTAIYKISKILLNLQRIDTCKVVRIWNDSFVDTNNLNNAKYIILKSLDKENECYVSAKIDNKEFNEYLDNIKRSKVKPKIIKVVKTSEELKAERLNNFINKVDISSNSKIKVISYLSSREKAVFGCKICGHEWSLRADRFFNGKIRKCPLCNSE